MNLTAENQKWFEQTWQNFQTKLSAERDRIWDKIPYIPEDGKYTDCSTPEKIGGWTNGFWPGMLWQMYHATGDEKYMQAARDCSAKLDAPLQSAIGVHHDLGFIYLHSAVSDYRLTENHEGYVRGMHAANLLAGRYNPNGHFIRAWNGDNNIGWVIVDCMMNIPLLYWAYEQTGDPRYRQIAMNHADKTLADVLRDDGSSNHVVAFDPETGEFDRYPRTQGYAMESSWSRGQSWALYGFALSYKHTGEQRYLDAAKRVAHYFLANVAMTGNVPLLDFRAPAQPVYYDSTAAMCAACGLLEIAKSVPEYEKSLYENGAVAIIKATSEKFANWDPAHDSILDGGSVAYHIDPKFIHCPIIYGDYFFLEAVLRVLDKDFFIW